MDPEKIALIRESFGRVAPMRGAMSHFFFERLFELDPSLRLHITGSLTAQRSMVMAALELVISALDNPALLSPVMEDIAHRFAAHGIKPAHLKPMADAWLWTLQQGLGPRFTLEMRSAWQEVLATLSDLVTTVLDHTAAAA